MEVFLTELKAKRQRELLIGVNNAENAFHHLKSYAIPDMQPTHDLIHAVTQQSLARRKLQSNPFVENQVVDAENRKQEGHATKLPAIVADAEVPLSVKLNEGLRNIKDQKTASLHGKKKRNAVPAPRDRAHTVPTKGRQQKKGAEFQWMLAGGVEPKAHTESAAQAQKRTLEMYKEWKREQDEQAKPYYEKAAKPDKSATCYWCRRLEKWCGWCHLPQVYVDPKAGMYATEGNDAWLRRPMSKAGKQNLLGKAQKKQAAKKGDQRSISSLGRIESQPFGTNGYPEEAETQQQARARQRQMAAVSKEKILEVMSGRKPVLFRMLTDSELVTLSEMVTIRKFAAHEMVVKQGSDTTPKAMESKDHRGNLSVTIGPAMYVALDGVFSVEVDYREQDGEADEAELQAQRTASIFSRAYSREEPPDDPAVEKVAQLTRGDAFGEFSMVTGCRRCCTVRASLPAAAIEVFRSDISAILSRRRELEESKQHMIKNIKKTAKVVSAIHHEVDLEKKKEAQHKKHLIVEKFRHKAEMKVFGLALTALQREREWRSGLNARRLKKLFNEWMRETYARVIQRFFRVKIGTRRLRRITEQRMRKVRSAKHVQRVIRGFLGRRAVLRHLKAAQKPPINFREVNQRRHREIREAIHRAAVRELEDAQWARDRHAEEEFYAQFKQFVRAQKAEHCREILTSIVTGTLLGFSFRTICESIHVPHTALTRWMYETEVVHKRRDGEPEAVFEKRKQKIAKDVENAIVGWYENNPHVLKLVGDWRNDLVGHEKEDSEQKKVRKYSMIQIDNMKSLQEILTALKTEERQHLGVLSSPGSAAVTEGGTFISRPTSVVNSPLLWSDGKSREWDGDPSEEDGESNEESGEEAEVEEIESADLASPAEGSGDDEPQVNSIGKEAWETARKNLAPLTLMPKKPPKNETKEEEEARKARDREEAVRRGHGRDQLLRGLGERIRKANSGFGVRVLFESLDRDADGKLKQEEVIIGFNVLKVRLNLLEIKETMAHLDPEHQGLVSVSELIEKLSIADHAATSKGVELSEGGGFTGLVLAAERASEQDLEAMAPSWDPLHGPIKDDSSDDEDDDRNQERIKTFSDISDLAADLYRIVFPDWTDLDLAIMRDKVRCRVLYEIGPFMLPTGETHHWKTFKHMATVLRTVRQGLWKELIQEIVNWDLSLVTVDQLQTNLRAVKKEMHAIQSGKGKLTLDVAKLKKDLNHTLPEDPDTIPAEDPAMIDYGPWKAAVAKLSPALQQMVKRVKEHTKGGGGGGLAGMRAAAKGHLASKLGRKVKGKAKQAQASGESEQSVSLPTELVELDDWLTAHISDAKAAEHLRSEMGRMTLEQFFNAVWGIRALDHWVDGITSLYTVKARDLGIAVPSK